MWFRKFIISLIFVVSALGVCNKANAQNAEKRLHGGYRGMIEVGGGPGVGFYGDAAVIVSTTQGWQFGPHFFLGAGVALNRLNMFQTAMYDFFADVRIYLNPDQWTPSAGIKLGYSPFTTYNNGPYRNFARGDSTRQHGIFVAPSIGTSAAINSKIGVSLTVSDNIQVGRFYSDPTLTITSNNANTAPTVAKLVNTIVFTVGFYW
jgi:hypothetical protein